MNIINLARQEERNAKHARKHLSQAHLVILLVVDEEIRATPKNCWVCLFVHVNCDFAELLIF